MNFITFFSKSQTNQQRTTPALCLTDFCALSVVGLTAIQLLTDANPIGRCYLLLKQFKTQERRLTASKNVNAGIDTYNDFHHKSTKEVRNKEYKSLVNAYYDLATLFYEWGWGPSFHFAFRYGNESFAEAIRRHEYYLASKLGLLNANSKLLDVGCGIGGPMRNIARFTGAQVTGLTLNPYQVERGNELCREQHLQEQCTFVQGDFMDMPFPDNSFHAAYAIEATCHAPDRHEVYQQIYRALKPGSIFACYEWCMTDKYIPGNVKHERIKKMIEEGDGLPDICHTSVCSNAMVAAGFELLEERDMALDDYGIDGQPWMMPLLPSWNITSQRFQFNCLGFQLTNGLIRILEFLWLAPKGTFKTQQMLQMGGFGLGDGGKLQIFTPMYLMVGRVPMNKQQAIIAGTSAAGDAGVGQ